MHKLHTLILVVLTACTVPLNIEDVREEEYGELYALMNCWWADTTSNPSAVFSCSETLETDLISGYVSLAIQEDLLGEYFFSICGKDVTLNSGYALHDTTVSTLTANVYACIDSYETKLGNEFDWLWDRDTGILQLIWRPKNELVKVLTLFIPNEEESQRVEGRVYYKTTEAN
jgi:hypothetical protein